MGLGNNSHSVYIGIHDGKIVRRYKVAMDGITKTRTTSNGTLVHEQYFDHVSGYITDISILPPKVGYEKFGETLIIKIVDGEDNFSLQMKKDSGYAVAFFKIMPNIDFTKRTTIIPHMKMENEKKKVTIFITQQGVSGVLKHFYTKDNPKGMPELKKVEFKGEVHWDNFEMMKFFTDVLNTTIIPKIKGVAAALPATPQNTPADARVTVGADDINSASYDDDLPF